MNTLKRALVALTAVVAIAAPLATTATPAAAAPGSNATSYGTAPVRLGHNGHQCQFSAGATDIGSSVMAITYRYSNCAVPANKAACGRVYQTNPTQLVASFCQPYTYGDAGRVTAGVRFNCNPGRQYRIEAMFLYSSIYEALAFNGNVKAGPVTCTYTGPA